MYTVPIKKLTMIFKFPSIITIFLVLVVFSSSCRVEKKQYSSGYYIQWHHHAKDAVAKKNNPNNSIQKSQDSDATMVEGVEENAKEETITASADQSDQQMNQLKSVLDEKLTATDEVKQPAPITQFKSEFKKGAKRILEHQAAKSATMNGLALAGFIVSLVGLVVFGIVLGILAIILSGIGLYRVNQDPINWNGKGLAIAGIIIGILDIVGWFIFISLL